MQFLTGFMCTDVLLAQLLCNSYCLIVPSNDWHEVLALALCSPGQLIISRAFQIQTIMFMLFTILATSLIWNQETKIILENSSHNFLKNSSFILEICSHVLTDFYSFFSSDYDIWCKVSPATSQSFQMGKHIYDIFHLGYKFNLKWRDQDHIWKNSTKILLFLKNINFFFSWNF
jgi:hypothetical protein